MRLFLTLIFSFYFLVAGELKIATFNVENLFDATIQGTEYSDFKTNWNNAKFRAKLKNISNVIKDLNADIIALQEIENKGVLNELAKESGYKYILFSKDLKAPVGVGIMSKIPFYDTTIKKITEVKTRDILKADFLFEGQKFSVFTTHLLTFKNGDYKRKINAKALENFTKNTKNAIVLGDFNTEFKPNSLVAEISKNNNLVNLWSTFFSKKSSHISGRAIDHILLSKSFFKDSNLIYKKNSFNVFNNSKYFNKNLNVSDHYPLFFTIVANSKYKTPNFISDVKKIDDFYEKDDVLFPLTLKNLAVVCKDKFGFSLADENKRGVYFFSRKNNIELSDLVEVRIYSTNYHNGNFQVDKFEIKKLGKVRNLTDFMLDNPINSRHGDVLKSINGDVFNGYINTKFGKFKIHSFNKKINNGKNQTFENVFVTNFKGSKELIVK
ncbi:MAG: endonuclease/exonuclease/phosphatase family protein [Campylobacter ureolyticus]|nr:endonuclease/exonuclease/phosphatase family protein [Campylobacter ureolyticus]MDK8322904.1 endonuclease/exonuclease/phosphatase family protein [Campylobacter ureolyticus]